MSDSAPLVGSHFAIGEHIISYVNCVGPSTPSSRLWTRALNRFFLPAITQSAVRVAWRRQWFSPQSVFPTIDSLLDHGVLEAEKAQYFADTSGQLRASVRLLQRAIVLKPTNIFHSTLLAGAWRTG